MSNATKSTQTASKRQHKEKDPSAFDVFKPLPFGLRKAILSEIVLLPEHWSFVPCQDKDTKHTGWQINKTSREQIISLLRDGKPGINTKYREDKEVLKKVEQLGFGHPELRRLTHTIYFSGFGLVTGDMSGGLFCIDIDGVSANPLLELILGGEPPKTVSWTSGKPGRRQLIYQVSDELRPLLAEFITEVPKCWDDLPGAFKDKYPITEEQKQIRTQSGDGLEFRYNKKYSVLPPSRHPQMGVYKWVYSPHDTEVAPLPLILEELIRAWCDVAAIKAEKKLKDEELAAKRAAESKAKRKQQAKEQGSNFNADEFDDIIEAANELNQRISSAEEGFDWEGHHFSPRRNGWLEGYCPRHDSASGTSFQAEDGGNHAWRCHACNISSQGIANYIIWRETGSKEWKGNTHLLTPYFEKYGIKLKKKELIDKKTLHDAEYYDAADRERHAEEESLSKAQKKQAKYDKFQARKEEYFKQRDLTVLPGHYTENTHFCSEKFLAAIPYTGLIGLQAAMGKGKTTTLKAWLTKLGKKNRKRQVIFIYSRIALGRSQAIALSDQELRQKAWEHKVHWIDDVGIEAFRSGKITRLGLCYDSLYKLGDLLNVEGITIVMDEVESGLAHLLMSSTHKENRPENIAAFVKFLRLADENEGACLVADATLRVTTMNYLKQFMPRSAMKAVINTSLPKKRQTILRKGKKGSTEERILSCIENDVKIAMATDSKKEMQTLARMAKDAVREGAKKIICLDSDNSKTQEGLEIVQDLDGTIERDKPDAFFFSPSLANGLSIDYKHFQIVFGLFMGVITPIEGIQQMARDRNVEVWEIFAKDKFTKGTKAQTVEEVKKDQKRIWDSIKELVDKYIKLAIKELQGLELDTDRLYIDTLIYMLEQLKKDNYPTMSEEHSWYYYQLVADSNFARANFYEVLKAELEREGHEIILEEGYDCKTTELFKEANEKLEWEQSEMTSKADGTKYTSFAVAHEVEQFSPDPEARRDAIKSKVVLTTGVKDEEVTPEFYKKYKFERDWFKKYFLYYLLLNPEIAEKYDLKSLERLAKAKFKQLEVCPHDVKVYLPQVITLCNDLKALELIDMLGLNDPSPDLKFSANTPGLKEWALQLDKLHGNTKSKIAKILNEDKFPEIVTYVKVKGQRKKQEVIKAGALAKWVLEKVGFKFESGKKNNYEYKLHPDFLCDEERQVLLTGLDRKYKGGSNSQEVQETLVEMIQEQVAELTEVERLQQAIADSYSDDTIVAKFTQQETEEIIKMQLPNDECELYFVRKHFEKAGFEVPSDYEALGFKYIPVAGGEDLPEPKQYILWIRCHFQDQLKQMLEQAT